MRHALTSPEDDLSPRRALATDLCLGGAIGTLLGLLVGLSGSTAVAAIAAAATALAGSVLVLRGSETAIRPTRAGALAVAAIASLVLGTWLERHGSLGPTPKQEVEAWQEAGFRLYNAQMIATAIRTGSEPRILPRPPRLEVKDLMRAGLTRKQALVHMGLLPAPGAQKQERTDAEYCADLKTRNYTPEQELKSWTRRGGSWAEAAKEVQSHPSCKSRGEAMDRMRAIFCADK